MADKYIFLGGGGFAIELYEYMQKNDIDIENIIDD